MAGNNTNALSADSVVSLAAQALRKDGEAPPTLRSPYEAVALIGHASMTAVGFKLYGLGEDHIISRWSFPIPGPFYRLSCFADANVGVSKRNTI